MTPSFDQDAFIKSALAYGKDATLAEFTTFVEAGVGNRTEGEKLSIYAGLVSAYHVSLSGETFSQASSRRFEHVEALLREMIKIAPNDAYNWIALAEHFHYYAIDIQEARSTIDVAVQKAVTEGNFVRQAYGVLIRIALAQGDYSAVEQSLAMLCDYAPSISGVDVALERDFIGQIPAGAVAAHVLERYRAALQRNGVGPS